MIFRKKQKAVQGVPVQVEGKEPDFWKWAENKEKTAYQETLEVLIQKAEKLIAECERLIG